MIKTIFMIQSALLLLCLQSVSARIPIHTSFATDRGGGEPISLSPDQLEEIHDIGTDHEEIHEDLAQPTTTTTTTPPPPPPPPLDPTKIFSIHQPGDGHEDDQDGIPSRFLRMQQGNRQKAKAAFLATKQWREEHRVDTILARPHAKFDLCCRALPHCFLGRDAAGKVIFCQRPGFFNLTMMGVLSKEDLLYHYTYVLEYCWNVLEPSTNGTMTSVLDLTGVTFGKMKEMMGFVKEFVRMMSSHYPQRSFKTLLINCPGWFGTLFNLIKPLLRESTKEKIQILNQGHHQTEVLKTVLGTVPDDLITGKPSTGWENLSMEVQLREFCLQGLIQAGMEMSTL